MKLRIYITLIFTTFANLFGEESVLPADTLYSIKWGTGQEYGRDYFPNNIFGMPDTSARGDVPTVDPKQIVSLGENGEIVLGWKDSYIIDGEGNDFYVFENCFTWGDGKLFAEPGLVSVSKDGTNFVQFPFDPFTLNGMAGKVPTYGSGSILHGEFGGDGFDLHTIGIDSIRYIKIKDTSVLVKSDSKHPFYNPVATGFDLDAIVGVNFIKKGTISSVEANESYNYNVQIRGNNILFLKNDTKEYTLDFYNTNGELLQSATISSQGTAVHYVPNLDTGIYYIVVNGSSPSTFKYVSIRL